MRDERRCAEDYYPGGGGAKEAPAPGATVQPFDLTGVTVDLDGSQESINEALAAIVAAGGGTVTGGAS